MDLRTLEVNFVLIVFYFGIDLGGPTYEYRNIGPFGPKMCEKLCQSFKQCDSPVFDENNLTCYLWSSNTTLADEKFSQRITSRLKGPVTIKIKGTHGQVTDKVNVSEITGPQRRTTNIFTDKQSPSTRHSEGSPAESELMLHNRDINLHKACEDGKLDVVKYILSQGVEDINSRGKHDRTPVMTAVLWGRLDVFNYLVKRGCDLLLLDDHKRNVLHLACIGGYINTLKRILSLDVIDIESKTMNGWTPVMFAAMHHKSVVDLLVSKQCNMTVVNVYGDTILHILCGSRIYNLVKRMLMLKHILSLNVIDIDSTNDEGITPVMSAAEEDHKSIVNLLVSKHCNMKAVDNNGNTILHLLCEIRRDNMVKRIAMLKYILSLNVVDMESTDKFKQTPLMSAVRINLRPVVDFLVSKHCNMKAVNNVGNTVLHLACRYGHGDMVKHLLSLGVFTGRETNKWGQTPAQVNSRIGTTLPDECKLN